MTINTIDEFLNHRAFDRSGGMLERWASKRKPPVINTWLHTLRMPAPVWRHNFPKIVVREPRSGGPARKEIWGGQYVCAEDEAVLKKQYKRDEHDQRLTPPKHCAICRLNEWLRSEVRAGRLDWTATVFRFQTDDDVRVLHAGGLYGAFGSDKLDDEQLADLRDAGILRKDAWKENANAKLAYLFLVVDDDNPGAGVQITIEPNLLGDKVREVIVDATKSLGPQRGNPFRTPYCIQWENCPNELEFQKRYKARRMELITMSPEVEKLVRGPLPSYEAFLKPFNAGTMRALMETHCVLKDVPWDEIFADDGAEDNDPALDFPPIVEQPSRALPAPPARPPVPVAKPAHDEDECSVCGPNNEGECPHVACDACDKPILETDPTCAHCGHVYGPAEAPPPPPPPAPVRTRGKKPVEANNDKVPF